MEAALPGVVSLFRLRPGSNLMPHTGPSNLRMTLHLSLQIPVKGGSAGGGPSKCIIMDGVCVAPEP